MDIDKILHGQLSAVEVLKQQAEKQSAVLDQIRTSGAAHRHALEALQNPYNGYLANLDQLRLSAVGLASAGLPRNYVDTLVMGGVSDQAYRQAMEGVLSPPDISSWLPTPGIGSSIADLFKTPELYGLSEALARLSSPATGFAGIGDSLARFSVPAIDTHGISEALARLSGPNLEFLNSASRIADLFGTDLAMLGRDAARDSLGDWRDPVAFLPNLELPPTRLQLYSDQGMSDGILDLPADDSDLQEYVEEALLDIEDDGNVAAYRLLMHLENALRRLIRIALEEAFGPKWWKQRVPPDVRDRCEAKLEDAVAAGAEDTHPIDYADFTDYEKIICRSDNFKEAFQPVFGRVEDVRESLQRLHPVRLICMHSRIVKGPDLILVQFEAPRILSRVKARL